MDTIAHIVNPVRVSNDSDLFCAQPITFESMEIARSLSKDVVAVELYAICYQEDREIVPGWMEVLDNLDRSVLDLKEFQVPRKLPLIQDILDRLIAKSSAEWFIYSNVDIALMPFFYSRVKQLIDEGTDACIINRRTIAQEPSSIDHLPSMWSQLGQEHPGFDCFVFSQRAAQEFYLADACIGANWIGRVLLANVAMTGSQFRIIGDEHLTFHLGDDRSWRNPKFIDYDDHNRLQLEAVMAKMASRDSKVTEFGWYRELLSDIARSKQLGRKDTNVESPKKSGGNFYSRVRQFLRYFRS